MTGCPVQHRLEHRLEHGLGRRGFLAGLSGLALAGTGGALADRMARADATPAAPPASDPAVQPFHGATQPGVIAPAQRTTAFLALDVTAADRAELTDLMRTLTARARVLTSGSTPVTTGIAAPPADSGTLGATVPAGGLRVTLGVGSTLFDDRFGLAGRAPRRLRPMDTFVDDDLDRANCDGDLSLQLSADEPDVVVHAMRELLRATRGAMQPRWRVDGFVPPARPSGAARNLLGFKDGIANPDVTDAAAMSRLVWVGPGSGEPDWAVGGTYQVARVIRMFVEFWDRVTLAEQERMIGRRKDTGAPLSGQVETDVPAYASDPMGGATPLDAHIRLANPRTAATESSRILRRSYSYHRGIDANGNLDMGLLFLAYQQDLDRQFVAVQKRLAGEPLVDYVSPVGGGYFLALPGVRDSADWYGRALLA